MAEKDPGKFVVPKGGVFNDLTQRIKLIMRLMGDQRVNPLLKLLPIFSLAYLLIPDLVLGPFDDAAIIWLGSYLFVELCPPDVVKEHTEALNRVIPGQWQESHQEPEDVIDVEFREK
jgi:hypothetical protein